jgi:hypothetical protein
MTHLRRSTIAMALLLICQAKADAASLGMVSDVIGPGWQCLLVPTSFDGPGTIFSVSTTGEKSRIIDLQNRKLIKVYRGEAALPKLKDSKQLSSGIVVSLLQHAVGNLDANLKAEGKRISGASAEYSKLTEETTFESEVDPIAEHWFKANVKPQSDQKYFIVRDAYTAGIIKYDFTGKNLIDLGGEANFKKIFQLNGTLLNVETGDTCSLEQSFTPPIRVCIRASAFQTTSGVGGVTEYHVSDQVGVVPEIRKYKNPFKTP